MRSQNHQIWSCLFMANSDITPECCCGSIHRTRIVNMKRKLYSNNSRSLLLIAVAMSLSSPTVRPPGSTATPSSTSFYITQRKKQKLMITG